MTVRSHIAAGGFIFGQDTYYGMTQTRTEPLCTVGEAVEAYRHMRMGPRICEDRGHDYSIRVWQTPNGYTCFRCGEMGWMVPVVSVD